MKDYNENNYCLILAGGKGKRLWPVSREDMPKQFLDFFSTGQTLLQQCYARMKRFISPENIFVATNAGYEDIVREQLPGVSGVNLLLEPVSRNTAPSVAWATFRILHRDPKARIVIVPSDQMIVREDDFESDILSGMEWAATNGALLAMGVKPTRPEPGYGYIQVDDDAADGIRPKDSYNIYKVKSFTEKPEREFARMFMRSGEFYWNTGIFIASCSHLRLCLEKIFPEVLRAMDRSWVEYSVEAEERCIEENYSSYPNLSIDYGILEKSGDVHVMLCSFGWADLGTWHSVYETVSRGDGDNVLVASRALLDDCRGTIVKLPRDHVAVLNGLNGYIVAEQGNVLLVCKKEDSSALIRKYIAQVQLEEGDEFV